MYEMLVQETSKDIEQLNEELLKTQNEKKEIFS